MKNLLIVVIIWISIISNLCQREDLLNEFKYYAENFQPTYKDGDEILVVARIPSLPDTLNNYLYECIENDKKDARNYAFLIIMKLKEEFIKVNNSDYDFCYYENNGVVDLVFNAIGKEREPIGCSFTKSFDIYKWLLDNPNEYIGYRPLEEQMMKITELLK
jgi:hypothetical protein